MKADAIDRWVSLGLILLVAAPGVLVAAIVAVALGASPAFMVLALVIFGIMLWSGIREGDRLALAPEVVYQYGPRGN